MLARSSIKLVNRQGYGCSKDMARLSTMVATTTSTEEYWMPFTHNRGFKKNPKVLHKADAAFYYLGKCIRLSFTIVFTNF